MFQSTLPPALEDTRDSEGVLAPMAPSSKIQGKRKREEEEDGSVGITSDYPP